MSAQTAPARPSASVVIVRDGETAPEVLLLRRNENIVFHGGAWVFPGGRVDEGDGGAGSELDIARNAAVREAREETGLTLEPQVLAPFSHWTTPVDLPKRFATWFFLAAVPRDARVTIDDDEIVDYRWLDAAAALAQHDEGAISLPGPTYVTLVGFRAHADVAALSAHVRAAGVARFTPRLVPIEGGRCALYAEDAGYATLDPAAPGARHRLVMRGAALDYQRDY